MKRIEFNTPSEDNSRKMRQKLVSEIISELENRLQSQGLKPDFFVVSNNYKNRKKEAFPSEGVISGSLSQNENMVVATISLKDCESKEQNGALLYMKYEIEKGKAVEAYDKAADALKKSIQAFTVDVEDKKIESTLSDPTKDSITPLETIELNFSQSIRKKQTEELGQQKEVIINNEIKTLEDDSNKDSMSNTSYEIKHETNQSKDQDKIKQQLISVNFTPEQAEVVIDLLEEQQKNYEPKSSMFNMIGTILHKMMIALNNKLDEIIDSEKENNKQLDLLYAAISNAEVDNFIRLFNNFDRQIKHSHEFICEAAEGKTIQSTDILNHILNVAKTPVSIRTLQDAYIKAIDNNFESALHIFKYADKNLSGEIRQQTMRAFLEQALNCLPDDKIESLIAAAGQNTFNDTVILKEMCRAEKYDLFNASLSHCSRIEEVAPALFYFAAQRKDPEVFHALINQGADINANGSEALVACLETNKVEAAKVLINYGADVNILKEKVGSLKNLPEKGQTFMNDIYSHCGITSENPNDEVRKNRRRTKVLPVQQENDTPECGAEM